jgi:DNA-binding CsgD family transcriptional regulator
MMTKLTRQRLLEILLACLILGGQAWLTDFTIFQALNIRLLAVMALSVWLLTLAKRKGLTTDLKILVAVQVLVIVLLTITFRLFANIANQDVQAIDSLVVPLSYGLLIYCVFLLFYKDKQEKPKGVDDSLGILVSYGLTVRECAIAKEIIEGKTNKEIAQVLYIAESTVKKHIQNMYKKIGCDNRQEFMKVITRSSAND